MARGDISCPIDGTILTLPAFTRIVQDQTPNEELTVGSHVHFTVTANGVCSNGHRWVIEDGEIIYRRIV